MTDPFDFKSFWIVPGASFDHAGNKAAQALGPSVGGDDPLAPLSLVAIAFLESLPERLHVLATLDDGHRARCVALTRGRWLEDQANILCFAAPNTGDFRVLLSFFTLEAGELANEELLFRREGEPPDGAAAAVLRAARGFVGAGRTGDRFEEPEARVLGFEFFEENSRRRIVPPSRRVAEVVAQPLTEAGLPRFTILPQQAPGAQDDFSIEIEATGEYASTAKWLLVSNGVAAWRLSRNRLGADRTAPSLGDRFSHRRTVCAPLTEQAKIDDRRWRIAVPGAGPGDLVLIGRPMEGAIFELESGHDAERNALSQKSWLTDPALVELDEKRELELFVIERRKTGDLHLAAPTSKSISPTEAFDKRLRDELRRLERRNREQRDPKAHDEERWYGARAEIEGFLKWREDVLRKRRERGEPPSPDEDETVAAYVRRLAASGPPALAFRLAHRRLAHLCKKDPLALRRLVDRLSPIGQEPGLELLWSFSIEAGLALDEEERASYFARLGAAQRRASPSGDATAPFIMARYSGPREEDEARLRRWIERSEPRARAALALLPDHALGRRVVDVSAALDLTDWAQGDIEEQIGWIEAHLCAEPADFFFRDALRWIYESGEKRKPERFIERLNALFQRSANSPATALPLVYLQDAREGRRSWRLDEVKENLETIRKYLEAHGKPGALRFDREDWRFAGGDADDRTRRALMAASLRSRTPEGVLALQALRWPAAAQAAAWFAIEPDAEPPPPPESRARETRPEPGAAPNGSHSSTPLDENEMEDILEIIARIDLRNEGERSNGAKAILPLLAPEAPPTWRQEVLAYRDFALEKLTRRLPGATQTELREWATIVAGEYLVSTKRAKTRNTIDDVHNALENAQEKIRAALGGDSTPADVTRLQALKSRLDAWVTAYEPARRDLSRALISGLPAFVAAAAKIESALETGANAGEAAEEIGGEAEGIESGAPPERDASI